MSIALDRRTTRPIAAAAAAITSGLFAVAAIIETSSDSALVRLAVLGAALGSSSAYDLAERRIPNRVLAPAILACLALDTPLTQRDAMLPAATVAALFLLALAQPTALGMGDAKLTLLLLVALGPATTHALTTGFTLAALTGLATTIRTHRALRQIRLPLAPFLTIGALAATLT